MGEHAAEPSSSSDLRGITDAPEVHVVAASSGNPDMLTFLCIRHFAARYGLRIIDMVGQHALAYQQAQDT